MTAPARSALVAAGLLGSLHAAFSIYWGVGGTWLVRTLGDRMVDAFAGWEWLLVPVGLVKLVAAWFPTVAARAGWPARPLSRGLCWAGALVLVVWGGLNTVVGNLVRAGLARRPEELRPHDGRRPPGSSYGRSSATRATIEACTGPRSR